MINIYTDGSCQNNGEDNATCGWGFVVAKGSIVTYEDYGKIREGKQTVFRAELESFLQVLLYIRQCDNKLRFTIYTDSLMLADAVNGLCSRRSNKDIWSQIEDVSKELIGRVEVKHVPSHTDRDDLNSIMNAKADRLAKQGALNLFGAPIKISI